VQSGLRVNCTARALAEIEMIGALISQKKFSRPCASGRLSLPQSGMETL